MHVCDVPLMLVFYVLLRPVSKNLALLAILFTAVQTAVLVATKLSLLVGLFLLGSADYLKAFEPRQLQALTYVSRSGRMDTVLASVSYSSGVRVSFWGI